MTKAQFDKLSDEDAFRLCCPGIIEGDCDGNVQAQSDYDINRMAY